MPRTRIGFNVGSEFSGGEWEEIYTYARKANPTTMLFMEGLAEAIVAYDQQKFANPDTEPVVIYRDYAKLGHDEWYEDVSADDFLARADQIVGRHNQHIWLYILNEPHENGEQAVRAFGHKLARIADALCGAGYKIVMGNFSAGTIDHPEWMEPYLHAAAKWGARGQFLLSAHWYSTPTPPAGYILRRIGDGPTAYATMPIENALDFLHPRHWLTREQVQHAFNAPVDAVPMWHYGRIKRFYQYARDVLGIELPKFVITEGFLDGMPDLKFFNGSPRTFWWNGADATIYQHILRVWGKPSDVSEIKGDLSYRNMWTQVYDLAFDEAMFLMWSWMDRTMPEECLGVTLFTASHARDWDLYGHNFYDIQGAWLLMQDEAETRPGDWVGGRDYDQEDAVYRSFENVYVEPAPGTPSGPHPPAIPTPAPDDQWVTREIVSLPEGWGSIRVRTGPGVARPIFPSLGNEPVGTLRAGDVISVEPDFIFVVGDQYLWRRVRSEKFEATLWVADVLELMPVTPPSDDNEQTVINMTFLEGLAGQSLASKQITLVGWGRAFTLHVDGEEYDFELDD